MREEPLGDWTTRLSFDAAAASHTCVSSRSIGSRVPGEAHATCSGVFSVSERTPSRAPPCSMRWEG